MFNCNLFSYIIFRHLLAFLYLAHNNIISVTMQPRKAYSYTLFSQHVSTLVDHHQVFIHMLKLLNCIEYNFITSHVP
jgi:hypothetical protein